MGKIEAVTLRHIKIKEKEYTIADGNGLSLLVKPNSKKLWIFRYISPITLKNRKTSLGNYPNVSLATARKITLSYQQLLSQNIDPIDNKHQEKEKIKINQLGIFENVVEEWFTKQKLELAPSTYKRKVGQFQNDVLPFFKGRLISTIKHPEVVKLLEMKAIKTVESASRLFQYLNSLWLYAVMKGYCDFNIISNIDKKAIIPSSKKKHYSKITDEVILKELINAIYGYKGLYSVKNALKFVLHLPLRAKNLISLKWEQIDFENKVLTIPREEMKAKDKNIADFVMPLTPQVIEILEEQKFYTNGNLFVFQANGYSDEPINSESPNRALQLMGFNDDTKGRKIRLHSFRGTFRSLADTYLQEHNVSYEAREKSLDHLPTNRIERAYTHKADYLQELRVLMRWWSDYIKRISE